MQNVSSDSTNNRIDELLNDHQELVEHLQSNGQLHMLSNVEDAFSKTLIVAIASYFEVRLTQIILEVYRETTQGSEVLVEFVRRQAIGRRFAQLFQWGNEGSPGPNANSFYRLFGDGFSTYMRQRVQNERNLDEGVKAFIEIGNIRNYMVHGNYADFQLNKTAGEVYSLYETASKFIDEFPTAIREFTSRQDPMPGS